MNNYKYSVYNWMYEESIKGTPFDDLPDDWKCPGCGAPKEAFEESPFYLIK